MKRYSYLPLVLIVDHEEEPANNIEDRSLGGPQSVSQSHSFDGFLIYELFWINMTSNVHTECHKMIHPPGLDHALVENTQIWLISPM